MTLHHSFHIAYLLVVLNFTAAFAQTDTLIAHDLLLRSPRKPFTAMRAFNPMLLQPATRLDKNNLVVASGHAGFVSNTVDVKLLKAAYDNVFITRGELERVYDRDNVNTVSAGLSVSAGAIWGNDTTNHSHGVFLEWRNDYGFDLSKGLTGLVYFGNAPFENESVTVNGKLKSHDFRKLQYVHTYKAASNFSITGSVGLLQAMHAYEGDMKGSVFTATDGEYIDMDYDLSLNTYDTKRFFNFDATGATYALSVLYHNPGGNHFVGAGLQEAGWIAMPKYANYYKADTAVTFDGFHIDDVFGLNDSSFVNLDSDSIKRYLGLKEGEDAFTSGIPAKFFLSYDYRTYAGMSVGFEAFFAPAIFKTPYVAAHIGRWWRNVLFTDLFINTQTFKSLNAGLCLAADIHMKNTTYIRIKAQSGYLNAFVVPEKTRGLDALVELSYRF